MTILIQLLLQIEDCGDIGRETKKMLFMAGTAKASLALFMEMPRLEWHLRDRPLDELSR